MQCACPPHAVNVLSGLNVRENTRFDPFDLTGLEVCNTTWQTSTVPHSRSGSYTVLCMGSLAELHFEETWVNLGAFDIALCLRADHED